VAENEFLKYTRREPAAQEGNEFLKYVQGEPSRSMNAAQAFASGAADGLTFGFGDEAMGVGGGISAALSGGDFGSGYSNAVHASRARQRAAQRDHQGWFLSGQVAGSTLPFIGPGLVGRVGAGVVGQGARAAAVAASRRFAMPGVNAAERLATGGGGNLTRRILAGMAIGAPYGFVAGAGHSDGETVGDYASDGVGGAILGGASGAAFPAVFGAAEGITQALRPTMRAVSTSAPKFGASGGGADEMRSAMTVGAGDPPAPEPPVNIEQTALDKFLRLVANSRQTLDDVQSGIDSTLRSDPGRGRTMVDNLGVSAEKTMKFLNKSTGQTAGLAEEVFSGRNKDIITRLENDLDAALPPPEMNTVAELDPALGGGAMMARRAQARQEFDRLRQEEYAKIWGTPVTPDRAQTANAILAQIAEDPIVQSAARRANEIWIRPQMARAIEEVSAGRPAPQIDPLSSNPLRQLHYIKRGLDEEVAWRNRPLSQNPLTEEEEATVRALRGTLRRALDDLIPGYRDANAKWGDESAAVYAMNHGRKLLRGRFNPAAMEELAAMTPFERQYATVGLKDDILETLRTGDKEGRRNIADALLNTETQRRLRAILGPDIAERIKYALSTESRLFRTASYAGARSGSDTGVFGAELLDDAVNIQKPNGPIDAAWKFGSAMLNDIASGMNERRRDALGRLLLQSTDDPYSAEQVKEIFRLLRERAEQRARSANNVAVSGAQSGAGLGQDRQIGY